MDSEGSEIKRTQEERKKMEQDLASLTSVTFDTDLYSADRFEGYERSIPVNDDDDTADGPDNEIARKLNSYTAPKEFFKDAPRPGNEDDLGFKQPSRIIDREDDYRKRRLNRVISPERVDPFLDKTPGPDMRSYADVMKEEALKRQKDDVLKAIAKKKEEEAVKPVSKEKEAEKPKKRNRWDQSQDDTSAKKAKGGSDWDLPDSTPGIGSGRWDATPTPGRIGDATPSVRKNRWDETPTPGRLADSDVTPAGELLLVLPLLG